MNKSIYVCHTYYHVYVSILKELAKPESAQGRASLVLSKMSTDFENLKERLQAVHYFENVYEYDEKVADSLPELAKFKRPSSNFLIAIWRRIRFTKALARAQEPEVPVDFSKFEDIYVFCDSDPIGYYLNYKKIYYHAIEDGLNTLKTNDLARADNTPHFSLKVFLSKRLNLIFVQNGYGKYCKDMEVNDISILKYPCPYYVEMSRELLYHRLTADEKQMLLKVFVNEREKLQEVLDENMKKTILILTEPLCGLDVRKILFRDLVQKYQDEGYRVILKQHPRDFLDYGIEFPDCLLIDRTVPMEMLNFFSRRFDLVLSVFTELDNVFFAKEKLRLGRDFMDKYEDRYIHDFKFESK